MIVDPESGLAGDVADDRAQAGVVDLAGPPAARADDVVVMRGLAADVGVLAVRQVETFDGADAFEQVERAEDGGPPDGGTGCLRGGDQLGGREMAVLLGDQRGQRAPRLRHAVAGAVEGSHDRGGVAHGRRLAQLRHSLINSQGRGDGPPSPRGRDGRPMWWGMSAGDAAGTSRRDGTHPRIETARSQP